MPQTLNASKRKRRIKHKTTAGKEKKIKLFELQPERTDWFAVYDTVIAESPLARNYSSETATDSRI